METNDYISAESTVSLEKREEYFETIHRRGGGHYTRGPFAEHQFIPIIESASRRRERRRR